ncbi:MAG TPA: hypothetical protein VIB01_08520 [Steroidobacteraceae bacterium]|jgi:hypothetical protein
MTTLYTRYTRTIAAALASVVIVGLTGLTLDRGHAGALPEGTIEVGEPQALLIGDLVVATLPAVEVIGSRDVMLADTDANDDGSQG